MHLSVFDLGVQDARKGAAPVVSMSPSKRLTWHRFIPLPYTTEREWQFADDYIAGYNSVPKGETGQ